MALIDHLSPSLAAHIWAKACAKKILLHRELADLGVKLLDLGFVGLRGSIAFPCKGRNDTVLGLLLPLGDLVGMYAVLTGELGQGVFAGQSIKGNSGFELGGKTYSLSGWSCPYKTGHPVVCNERMNSRGERIRSPLCGAFSL